MKGKYSTERQELHITDICEGSRDNSIYVSQKKSVRIEHKNQSTGKLQIPH